MISKSWQATLRSYTLRQKISMHKEYNKHLDTPYFWFINARYEFPYFEVESVTFKIELS